MRSKRNRPAQTRRGSPGRTHLPAGEVQTRVGLELMDTKGGLLKRHRLCVRYFSPCLLSRSVLLVYCLSHSSLKWRKQQNLCYKPSNQLKCIDSYNYMHSSSPPPPPPSLLFTSSTPVAKRSIFCCWLALSDSHPFFLNILRRSLFCYP